MGRQELDVEEHKAAGSQPVDEPGEGGFRGVGLAAMNMLSPKESAPEGDAVDAAGETGLRPDFHRMGAAMIVEVENRVRAGSG